MDRRDFIKLVASTFALTTILKAAKASTRIRSSAFDLSPGEYSLVPWQSGTEIDSSVFAIGDCLNLNGSTEAIREPKIDAVTGIQDPHEVTIRAGKSSLTLVCSGKIVVDDFGAAITEADNLLLTIRTKSGAVHSMNVCDVHFDSWAEVLPRKGQMTDWNAKCSASSLDVRS